MVLEWRESSDCLKDGIPKIPFNFEIIYIYIYIFSLFIYLYIRIQLVAQICTKIENLKIMVMPNFSLGLCQVLRERIVLFLKNIYDYVVTIKKLIIKILW